MIHSILRFFQKDKQEIVILPKMTVSELADNYNRMIFPDDESLPDDDTLDELARMYAAGFLSECNTVPDFELDKYGKILLKS